MNAIFRFLCLCTLIYFSMLIGLQSSKLYNKELQTNNIAEKNNYSKAELLYAGFDTDTPFDISPELFDMWYEDTSFVKVTLTDSHQIDVLDSVINRGEPTDFKSIDTRCRIIFTKTKNKTCLADSFYLSSTHTFHKNNGIMLKNDVNILKVIQGIIFSELSQ